MEDIVDAHARRYETLTECADRCRVSTRTLRNAITDGRLASYGIGRMIRLDPFEVDAFFARA